MDSSSANILQLPKSTSSDSSGRTQTCMNWNNRLAVQIGNSTKFGHVQNITGTDFIPLGLTSYFIVVFFPQNILCLLPCSIFLLDLVRGFWVNVARMTGICVWGCWASNVSEKLQVLRKYDALENMQNIDFERHWSSTLGSLYRQVSELVCYHHPCLSPYHG